jgi:hypothetical protein
MLPLTQTQLTQSHTTQVTALGRSTSPTWAFGCACHRAASSSHYTHAVRPLHVPPSCKGCHLLCLALATRRHLLLAVRQAAKGVAGWAQVVGGQDAP